MNQFSLNQKTTLPTFALAAFAALASHSYAAPWQDDRAQAPRTLQALVAEVLEKNPELDFYRAEILAANGERRTAGVRANPEVSAKVGDKRINSPIVSDGLAWSVSVKQTFEWPGRIPLRKAIADQQVKLAELGLDQFRSALAARTRSLAFQLFAAQEKAAATREVADRFRALREVLVQRDPAGLTPILETRIIEATELTIERKAMDASLAGQSARLALNQLRGEAINGPLIVSVPSPLFPAFPNTQALLEAARANNFDIRVRQAELEQQGFQVSLAANESKPTVTVEPYLSQERTGDRETQFGIGLSVPVPLGNRNAGRLATEEARRLQAETTLAVAYRNLERQVFEASLAYEARLGEMARWRQDSVKQFQSAAALADRHYRMGAVPIATYVELQKQYLEAVDTLLNTQRDALEASQELQRLTGIEPSRVELSDAAAKR